MQVAYDDVAPLFCVATNGKESERLTALINNILDFSRIEAGTRGYDFRETDIADLVRSTLDAYRFQIEQRPTKASGREKLWLRFESV